MEAERGSSVVSFVRTIACLVFCVVAFALSSVVVAVWAGGEGEDQGEDDAEPLDAATYVGMHATMDRLRLTEENLAAMGCSQDTVENLLGVLLAWYESKKESLAAIPIAEARKKLRQAIRKFNIGPRDEVLIAQIPALEKAHEDALKQEEDLIGSAIPAVEGVLTVEQREKWRLARVSEAPHDYRFAPNLTAEQLRNLLSAMRKRDYGVAVAKNEKQAKEACQTFKGAVEEILTSAQQEALATVKTNMRQHMGAVHAAFEKILPEPDELKMEE